MASYGTAKGGETCVCEMRKVRILEGLRSTVCKYVRHSARQYSAEASCTISRIHCYIHSSLHLGTLQRHPAPSAGSIAAPAPRNRRVTLAEFIKIYKWERTFIAARTALCTYGTLPRHSARTAFCPGTLHVRHSARTALCTLCRIHRCIFYHVYRPTWLFRAAALNGKLFNQRARRSRSRLFARIHPAEKTFAKLRGKVFSGKCVRVKKFKAKSFG